MSEENSKPVFDEQALDKLLEAAYVLQEHNRELRELELRLELKRNQLEAEERAKSADNDVSEAAPSQPTPPPDFTHTLGKIVETQHQIQVRQLSSDDAMSLVAERVIEISGCTGAAVCLVLGKEVRYQSVAGRKTLPARTTVPIEKALCDVCIKTGQVLRFADVNSEPLLDKVECRRRGIQGLIAAPVFHNGEVAGGLELYYAAPNAFTDHDVHTCQLMAGLVTEALVRDEEQTWKNSLATERAAMLDALEKLQPNLAALVEKSPSRNESYASSAPTVERIHSCGKCGHALLDEEQFCGECGSPRSSDYEPPNMQSKVASLWQMQETLKKETPDSVTADTPVAQKAQRELQRPRFETSLSHAVDKQAPPLLADAAAPHNETNNSKLSATDLLETDEEDVSDKKSPAFENSDASDTAPIQKLTRAANWSSAASARDFLEQLASSSRPRSVVRFWNTHRGDIYLGIAVLLVACVIRWGIWSSPSANATGTHTPTGTAQKKTASDGELSLFDRMLIQLGLAEPPDSFIEDKGDPSVQVWVDQRTALYYCPGSELYGKTPKGKYTSQREAQLDQFEPAYRKACN